MDGSRVTQCLDSLWFYTSILTCRYDPVASLTDQFAPSIYTKEPHNTDLQKPNTPLVLLNHQNEPQNVENLTPRCHKKCCEISSAFEEERVMPDNSEMVNCWRKIERRDRRKRRKWNKSGLNGMKVIIGGLDLGFDVTDVSGFLKFQESYRYQMLATQQQTKMPPFDDDVAMKQHLKSWAYAVACTIK